MSTHHHHHHHQHAIATSHNEKYLWWALGLTSLFLVIEIIGSLVTGSLALLSDAAHMLTDASALAISLAAIRIAKKAADARRTFGYHRFEILAAVFNAMLLFLVAMYIAYEAYQRFKNPAPVQTLGMMIIAGVGLVINVMSIRLLSSGKDHSLNIKSAYLEVWSDLLGSIGVIGGALVIYFTNWIWVDSLIAIFISVWILPRTWILLKDTINILLEGVPDDIDLEQLKTLLEHVEGVLDIHELHVWAITSGKISLTAHVVIEQKYNCEHVTYKLREILASKFGITHVTLQHEYTKCRDGDDVCNFT